MLNCPSLGSYIVFVFVICSTKVWTSILIYFLAFLPCVTCPPAAAVGPMGLIFGMRMYITYISVSMSTPLAMTSPYGQLASIIFSKELCMIHSLKKVEVFGLWPPIACISVGKPTPWTVVSPHWQLASRVVPTKSEMEFQHTLILPFCWERFFLIYFIMVCLRISWLFCYIMDL